MRKRCNYTLLIFCVCIIPALILPALLTRDWLWGEWFLFEETGPVGDTIGGIMNPFIAIGAAWLTYKAFVIQYEANQELKLNTEINRFETTFFNLLNMQHCIVNELILKVEVFSKNNADGKALHTDTVILHGRDKIRKIYEEGANDKIDLSKSGLIVYGGIKHCIAQHGYNYMSKNDELSFLDSYFRHLYRIVKFVNVQYLTEKTGINMLNATSTYVSYELSSLTMNWGCYFTIA